MCVFFSWSFGIVRGRLPLKSAFKQFALTLHIWRVFCLLLLFKSSMISNHTNFDSVFLSLPLISGKYFHNLNQPVKVTFSNSIDFYDTRICLHFSHGQKKQNSVTFTSHREDEQIFPFRGFVMKLENHHSQSRTDNPRAAH